MSSRRNNPRPEVQTDFTEAFCIESCGGRERKEPGRHSNAKCRGPSFKSCPAVGDSQTQQASAQEGRASRGSLLRYSDSLSIISF